MKISNKEILGRIVLINDDEYFLYKENGKTFIKLDNKIVYPNKEVNGLSASQWLKKIKNNL